MKKILLLGGLSQGALLLTELQNRSLQIKQQAKDARKSPPDAAHADPGGRRSPYHTEGESQATSVQDEVRALLAGLPLPAKLRITQWQEPQDIPDDDPLGQFLLRFKLIAKNETTGRYHLTKAGELAQRMFLDERDNPGHDQGQADPDGGSSQ